MRIKLAYALRGQSIRKGFRRKHHFDDDIAKGQCCSDRNSEEGQVD
jgi:hypothetical protein